MPALTFGRPSGRWRDGWEQRTIRFLPISATLSSGLHFFPLSPKGATAIGRFAVRTLTTPGCPYRGIGWTLAGEVSPAGDFVVLWVGKVFRVFRPK